VQLDELNNTKDKERRFRLLWRFTEISPALVPTESFLLDVSRLDLAKIGSGEIFTLLKTALDQLNGSKPNNVHDALIAEVAIVNGFTLLTSDYHLAEVAKENGAEVQYFAV
jgi:predicted nucleic acid-binding protein